MKLIIIFLVAATAQASEFHDDSPFGSPQFSSAIAETSTAAPSIGAAVVNSRPSLASCDWDLIEQNIRQFIKAKQQQELLLSIPVKQDLNVSSINSSTVKPAVNESSFELVAKVQASNVSVSNISDAKAVESNQVSQKDTGKPLTEAEQQQWISQRQPWIQSGPQVEEVSRVRVNRDVTPSPIAAVVTDKSSEQLVDGLSEECKNALRLMAKGLVERIGQLYSD